MQTAAERTAALHRFATLRLQAMDLMKQAAAIDGIPAHFQAQADTISGLCAIKLATITGEPDAEDFLALRDDLEAIAGKVDPLLLAVGKHAKANSSVVDLDLFKDVARSAIDGNACYELTAASERADEENHLVAAE